ncbi:MAG TPA: ROK family transcriptional regulator [Sphaerochaeta sp.]|mgnify:FL=1|jgi:predicted NBD/HSP70 family sugar kinase|nr:ROK family transcriptional regulator [Sphaerochaeta sp.]HQB53939.1 ROK family transcriptional regulator [Sphaerochaeta sp.]
MQNDDIEFINCANVLKAIETDLNQPSRAQIAKYLGLSRTAVSMVVKKLIAANLVTELEIEKSGRGRPGTPLALDGSYWHAIGAAYSLRLWTFCVVNLNGQPILTHTEHVETTDQDETVEVLLRGLRHVESKVDKPLLPGYGIGPPGLIDPKTGTVFRADDMGWIKELPLKRLVEEATGKKAFIINRYRANGVAELTFGGHDLTKNIMYIGVGTGIAGSVYFEGTLLNSTKYRFGHMVIDPHGPLCGCGQYGCLQAMASEKALLSYAHAKMEEDPTFLASYADQPITAKLLIDLAEQGDVHAQSCLSHIASALGIAILTIANVIAPDEVVIGGPIGDASTFLVDEIRKAAYDHLLDWQVKALTISKGSQGDYGSVLGAAAFLLEQKMELLLGEGCPTIS